ncbi:DNA polymerase I [Microbacterium phage Cen1621]|uniref:DNA polymerase n=1 Tax=Microbacterium phage Cen1621 TaxID=2965191 RepID=A0A9E7QBK6_9CAUD|nr:DNA polymerase I [Microbacterium phage Cen1621]
MIHLTHIVAGETCDIFIPERRDELDGFWRFLAQGDKVLGLDTETTGLDIYSRTFEVRLVQFGNRREAWVLRADIFRDAIIDALRQERIWTIHNAEYDLRVIDKHFGVTIEELANRVIDTRILAHLLDPRQPHEGGAGLSLKPLSAIYVDDTAPDTQEGLNAVFRTIKNPETGKPCNKSTGWRYIPLDHPLYLLYAGLDVILGSRLVAELAPLVKDLGLSDLSKFEHHLSALLSIMVRRGMRLDVPYTEGLVDRLLEEAEEHKRMAARYGVENVNSTAQVAECLQAMGVKLTERTESGALKVDKGVLLPLAGLTAFWEPIDDVTPNPLANAVIRAKRAEKWATSYGQAFLDLRDTDNRIHANIGGLAARTARMSVSRPPLQQLPSTDWTIRRAIVADPGNRFISADYDQVELRVLAALADVRGMKEAINSGVDLHGYTASLVYGPDFTPKHRKAAKGAGFGKVYGGGPVTLARQWGVPIEDMRHMVSEYDRVYPEVKKYAARLQRRAEYGKREVVTVSGRHLPLDRDRLYSATNYTIQSTARDIAAQAIVDLFDAGLGDYLRLIIHDEVLAEAPEREAEEVAVEVGRIMSSTFYGVPISAAGEVTGKSWGAAYGADPEAGW